MARAVRAMRAGFAARTGIPRPLLYVAVHAPRFGVAVALAALPALALFLAALWMPPEFLAALTRTQNVHDLFARFVSAVASASAIAVSVATLAMRRELRGIDAALSHLRTNSDFRERLQAQLGGGKEASVLLPDMVADVSAAIAARARELRASAGERALATRRRGVTLAELLDVLAEEFGERSERLRRARMDPSRMVFAILENEEEVTGVTLKAFRDAEETPPAVREELDALHELFVSYDVVTAYAKTLDTQWGLSRMSRAMLVWTVPAILTSAAMVLTYGDGAVAALSERGAAALVCGALALALLPIGAFISYLLRFVVVHQHTLPSSGFVLGPENELLARRG